MQIILIAVAALAIVLWVFNTTVRNLINAGIMNTLAWIVSHTPTIGGILVAILAIIAIPILLGVGWIGMWTSIGSWALSPMAGWIIAIGGIAMFIISLRWLIKPLMVISILTILFGACFPILKGALNEYGKDGEIQLANKVRGASLQMSPQGVLPAVVIEDAVLYDDNGKITTTKVILKTEVRTVDLEKKQFVGSAETFAHVMLPNLVGDFKDGSIGWIPVRKLHLGTNPPPPLTDDTSAKEKKVIEVSISGSEFPQSIEL
ncbi:MAG: hypothetical protein WC678_04815, partial [Parcubacteria group bacterium]